MGTLDEKGRLDSSGRILALIGKKRTGKSKLALLWFTVYEGDRLVIDVNGTDGPVGDDVIEIRGKVGDLPDKWPEHLRRETPDGKPLPMTIRYVPDAGSDTPKTSGQPGGMIADIDHMLSLAWVRGDVCILIHETGIVAASGNVARTMKRILQSNRHRRITCLFCAPRPITMDPLVIGQSDLVYIFELPNEDDQKRLAGQIGWSAGDLQEAIHDLKRYEYLRFDSNESKPEGDAPDLRLIHFEPLPEIVMRRLKSMTPSDM